MTYHLGPRVAAGPAGLDKADYARDNQNEVVRLVIKHHMFGEIEKRATLHFAACLIADPGITVKWHW